MVRPSPADSLQAATGATDEDEEEDDEATDDVELDKLVEARTP
jgi:hypothetical protein